MRIANAARTGFRLKVLVTMMLVVAAITLLGLYVAERNLATEEARALQSQFERELASLHTLQEVRHAALAERCRALVRKPRIHAALEDNALDLLYPSAKDELRDLRVALESANSPGRVLDAEFYRFLDINGAVIPPPSDEDVGKLSAAEELQLALPTVPHEQQLGYLVRGAEHSAASVSMAELIAVPIISTETEEPIAALVLGFKPAQLRGQRAGAEIRSGIWINGSLHLPSLPAPALAALGREVGRAIGTAPGGEKRFQVAANGVPSLLFYNQLNPASAYAPAYEVCLFPLTGLLERQRQVRWKIVGGGALMLLVGFGASHYASMRLAVPVEKLAVDSEVNRAERERAETKLEKTNVELQRSVRFSADASHQLKTPVTVLRAGLEELLAQENMPAEAREEISELVHQTSRLTGVIEDLLLLSRMDAGRLKLDIAPVDLSRLIESELDDLGAHPDALELVIDPDVPAGLRIAGEQRYTTLILRNLLENARKYNRPGGCVRVRARADGDGVLLTIANTGRPIPSAAQEHIFERFHRGSAAENIPGHGLGLNLARELARLHGGDVLLTRSDEQWTEFQVRFRLAHAEPSAASDRA